MVDESIGLFYDTLVGMVFLIDKISPSMSHMIIITSHIMVPTIILFGTLNFYLLFKFIIYKNQHHIWWYLHHIW